MSSTATDTAALKEMKEAKERATPEQTFNKEMLHATEQFIKATTKAQTKYQDRTNKKRKSRAPKDPNAPKKPQTPYFLYRAEVHDEMKAKFPDKKMTELASEIGKAWKGLSEKAQSKYVSQYQKNKGKYDKEMATYNATKVDPEETEDEAPAPKKKGKKAKTAKTAAK